MTRNPYYVGPVGDHFDGSRFFNSGGQTDRSLRDVLRWRRTSKREAWPAKVEVTPARPLDRVEGGSVTMVGHSTVLIQVGGVNVLTDPVWSPRASPLAFAGPRRTTEPGIRFEDLPPIDLVLLSHNHYDHLDLATLGRLHRDHAPQVVAPLGNDTILRRAIDGIRVAALDWGGRVEVAGGGHVTLVPARHWSARGIRDRRMALWGGFMLRMPEALIYYAGDTAYGDGAIFRRMRADHGSPDLALIPIGAYDPRWFMAAQHVDPEEAVQIMVDLEARTAVAIHWGCFQLTDEARLDPVERLTAILERNGIDRSRFRTPGPGDSVQLPPASPAAAASRGA